MLLALVCGYGLLWQGEKEPPETPIRPEYYWVPSRRHTLSEVTMRVRIASDGSGKAGVLTFPAPNNYSGQSIVSLNVQSNPAGALKSWTWRERADGLNDLVEATVAPGNREVDVSYSARVFLPGEGVTRTQHSDFASWLAPTASVQSKDSEIEALARELKEGASSRAEFVGKVIRWVAANKLRQNLKPTAQDAKSALAFGGDSLGRANLCAALLRAVGVPARTVATAPLWAERMDAEAWIVEFWNEIDAWEMVDPTVGVHPKRDSVIVLSISSLEDENREPANPLAFRPEAPRSTTPELSQGLRWASPLHDQPMASIHFITGFRPQFGARVMIAAMRRSDKVIAAAHKGQPDWFDDAVLKKVLSKGPINLALYLEGHSTAPDR